MIVTKQISKVPPLRADKGSMVLHRYKVRIRNPQSGLIETRIETAVSPYSAQKQALDDMVALFPLSTIDWPTSTKISKTGD